jgi:hypothetical protein
MNDELQLSADLRTAVLELGLEDRIPVPEIMSMAEKRVGQGDAVAQLRLILGELLMEGKLRAYRGHWQDDDPDEITSEAASALLDDPRWYRFRTEDPGEERMYVVNTENVRGG